MAKFFVLGRADVLGALLERPGTRLDSNVALSAILKGGSPSFGLRPALRKIGATVLA